MNNLLKGLVTRDFQKDYPDNKYRLLLGGNIVKLNWWEIEPLPGVFDYAVLNRIRVAAQHGPVGLRILGGANSPEWLLPKVGTFVYVEGTSGGKSNMPIWWRAEYQHRWEYMLRVVEREVGDLIDVIYQTGGATVFGEPFIRSPWQNLLTYRELGFNIDVDREALDAFYTIIKSVWPRQRVAVSVFPWQHINSDGFPRASLPDTKVAINQWKPDLIVANDLRETPGQTRLDTWIWMEQTGITLAWQTAQPGQNRIGKWQRALEWTTDFGAEYVELNREFTKYDYAELGAWGYELSR